MEIRPILASLHKHRIPALLIVLEIALACAVLCNAVFVIAQCVTDSRSLNAIDEQDISVIHIGGLDAQHGEDSVVRDLAALRAIAGVKAVAAINALPLGPDASFNGFTTKPNDESQVNTSQYLITRGAEKVLGMKLLQGRFFSDEEYARGGLLPTHQPDSHVVLINESDAKRLWPGQSALGQQIYSDGTPWTVIGVVANVLAQDPGFSGVSGKYSSAFFPLKPSADLSHYILRSAPEDRDRVLRDAMQMLGKLEPGAVLEPKTYVDIRTDYFASSRTMAWMLAMVCVVMLAVTALGIVGLTSFWVGQRRRQIGIRRAVGASCANILHYFQTENFLLSTAGVVLGIVFAIAINIYLMRYFELARMPWYYLGGGAVALWLLGQLSVLWPALRAAAVPPVVATRSI
ncbi:ABC transporter permease [Dyella caseinilytica]|uniref:ABC transporter permease n=1 Tax=Dyella caseinilytica TaxID=1849581 RepID=A0ABX7GRR5_9GAMM|nr:ABC transporter permease [Dyella caseinilytica]QRN52768.1 ABC transporter permease [Dyella caseinilytica]GGA08576.1 ABC transporter permease [Dyella caseinilytica]